jgi:hypothetical protein
VLDALRAQALPNLIEMARWRSPGHAYSARVILGRMAGIDEERLQAWIGEGRVDEILDAVSAGKR